MIIDCFPYFNEKELLELRYNVLKDYVDYFFIADANFTHRGEPKEFTCVETMKELGIPSDQMQVFHVELPSGEDVLDPWVRERAQRDSLSVPLGMMPDDTIFISSDCDEITNPEIIPDIKKACETQYVKVKRLSMSMHYGRADMQVADPSGEPFYWISPVVDTVKGLKEFGTLSELRASSDNYLIGDRDAGWHLGWMGDAERRKRKLSSIAEYYVWDKPNVQQKVEKFEAKPGNTDMLGREDHILAPYPLEKLPPEALTIERVRKFLLPDG